MAGPGLEITRDGVARLVASAPQLAPLAAHVPPRKIRGRSPGFSALARIVAEQAVSQASADAVWRRLEERLSAIGPRELLAAGPEALRAAGLSRAKVRCLLGLAEAVDGGALDLAALASATDDEVRRGLTAHRGIGQWTADIYLLLALGRPDVWPAHDLALQEALRDILEWPERPDARAVDAWGERLRPHRSTATILLWERYLSRTSASRP